MNKALSQAIERLLEDGGMLRMAIDGRCASGKTTLAAGLCQAYGAAVIHMDDFFLPAPLRSRERYAQPGGNVHYERFADEVAHSLRRGSAIEYRVFDCARMDYGGTVRIPPSRFVIVEGAYCLRPEFRDMYNFKLFSDIDKFAQKQRIEKRNGPEGWNSFRDKWIPLEEFYFGETKVKDCCDMILLAEE